MSGLPEIGIVWNDPRCINDACRTPNACEDAGACRLATDHDWSPASRAVLDEAEHEAVFPND